MHCHIYDMVVLKDDYLGIGNHKGVITLSSLVTAMPTTSTMLVSEVTIGHLRQSIAITLETST